MLEALGSASDISALELAVQQAQELNKPGWPHLDLSAEIQSAQEELSKMRGEVSIHPSIGASDGHPTTKPPSPGPSRTQTAGLQPSHARKGAGKFVYLGNGPCRDQHGTEPAHWNCQESNVTSARDTCESACSDLFDTSCLGFQVCTRHCTGLCIVFAADAPDVRMREWTKRCTFMPGSSGAVAQISAGETMWQCFKRSGSSVATSPPLNSHSVLLPFDNPLVDHIRTAIQSRHDFLSFSGKWHAPNDPTEIRHDFGLIYETFQGDTRYELEDGTDGICGTAKGTKRPNHLSDYVLITGLDENGGVVSCEVPNRTMPLLLAKGEWQGRCTEEGMRSYLGSTTLRAVVTSQHQVG